MRLNKKYCYAIDKRNLHIIMRISKEIVCMENEYAFQDATKAANNGKIVDEPIQSTMKGQHAGGGMLYLMFFMLYCIFFSMFFPS